MSPAVTIDGPLSVWNGQDELASITNDAGEWPHGDQGGLLENMFDGNLDTFWHSSGTTVNNAKTIKMEFKVTKTMNLDKHITNIALVIEGAHIRIILTI